MLAGYGIFTVLVIIARGGTLFKYIKVKLFKHHLAQHARPVEHDRQ